MREGGGAYRNEAGACRKVLCEGEPMHRKLLDRVEPRTEKEAA